LSESTADTHSAPREYAWRMPAGWWTRNRRYFLYVVREFTSVPLAIWLLWLLYAIWRGQTFSTDFAIFSIVALPFALYHSWTFLSLAGTILHAKVLDRPIPSRLIVLSQFAIWAVASIVIAALLVWFAK